MNVLYFAVCDFVEFACEADHADSKCIPFHQICDGVNDCSDGADEVRCDIGNHRGCCVRH